MARLEELKTRGFNPRLLQEEEGRRQEQVQLGREPSWMQDNRNVYYNLLATISHAETWATAAEWKPCAKSRTGGRGPADRAEELGTREDLGALV